MKINSIRNCKTYQCNFIATISKESKTQIDFDLKTHSVTRRNAIQKDREKNFRRRMGGAII